jgi:hypothetical protein
MYNQQYSFTGNFLQITTPHDFDMGNVGLTGIFQTLLCFGEGNTLPVDYQVGYLKIIIDGTTVFDNQTTWCFTLSSVKQIQNFSLSFNHRFNTSLQIQSRSFSEPQNARYVTTHVSYTIDD